MNSIKSVRKGSKLIFHGQAAEVCQAFVVTLVKQSRPVWCWAAVAVSLLETFGTNQPDGECGIVTQVKKDCKGSCQDLDACVKTSDIEDVFSALKIKNQPLVDLSSVVLVAVTARDPIVASVYDGDDTHLLIIHGYCAVSDALVIMDPKPGWDTHEWDLKHFKWAQAFRVPRQQAGPFVPPARLPKRKPPQLMPEGLEPAGATELIEQQLPTLIAAVYPPDYISGLQTGGLRVSPGLPIHAWSSQKVLIGQLEGLVFLGWRHILSSGEKSLTAIDVLMSDGKLAFKKASWGPAAASLDTAMSSLSDRDPQATEISLLEIPCLGIHALSYKDASAKEQFMVAFSPFPEFDGQPILPKENFIAQISSKARTERVTNQV